ncbi:sulfotransferase family protein [Actinomadura flavalba]|uniref:sulfotransferase family protein n=1 Tax=Actinomadura flavalba TaxID=1120938 RepID=UPI00036E8ECE|nr:sulfotransferase [Actinomadura flavalba]
MAWPDFFVIGAPKAGSTALHAALTAHPELFLSKVKEPKFFLTDGPPPTRGGPGDAQTYREHVWRPADYQALFDGAPAGTLRGEATPFYLHDRDAQLRIQRTVPHAKLIAVLRDPVERAHSNWAHLRSAGLEPLRDVVEACEAEPKRVAAGYAAFWQYVGLGRYGEQIQHLYKLFPEDQVLLLRYRDIRDDADATLQRICAFLGVSTGVITSIPRENVTTHVDDTPAARALQQVLRGGAWIGRHMPRQARGLASRPLLNVLQREKRPRQPLTPEQRAALLPYFADDVTLLQEITGNDYADWLR